VKRLVAAGADLEAENDSLLRHGSTALMMAMDAPEPDIAQFLFDSGASALGRVKQGKTLLARAIQRRWPGLALGMLKRHGSALYLESLPSKGIKRTALSWAACLGYVGIVRELLRLGANPMHCDPDGCSALYWATCGGNMEVISSIVERMQRDGCVDIKADVLDQVARHRRDKFKP
jgi:ankyrin repeat protein